MKKYCTNCGKEFEVSLSENIFPYKIFCSDKCKSNYYRRYYRELSKGLNLTNKQCPKCGKWFTPKVNFQKYCSAECREKVVRARPKNAAENCVVCGKPLKGTQRKYCSKKCCNAESNRRDREKREPKRCEICGGGGKICPTCKEKPTPKPKLIPKPKPAKTFEQIAREADECGLSYGKYKVQLKMGKTYEELKTEYESRRY